MVKRLPQRVCHETQSIQKIALTRSIRANKKRQRPKGDIALGDALIVP